MDPNGQEFWSARDLGRILQYSEYRHFQPVIDWAKLACVNSGHASDEHFVDSEEDVAMGQTYLRASTSLIVT